MPGFLATQFGAGMLTQAAIMGFVSGAVSTGNLKGGVQGTFSAMVFFGAGSLIAAPSFGISTELGIAIHAVAGCVTSVAGGNKCGPGALSAAFVKAMAPLTAELTKNGALGGALVSAVVGGTASVLGGGKFANGAQTGAFSYLFNHCNHVEGGFWTAFKDAAGMTSDWAMGRGSDTRVFGPMSIQVTDMIDAPGVNSAREFFYKKNSEVLMSRTYDSLQSVNNYGAAFGLVDLFTTSSPTQQFVGSYRIDIWPVNKGDSLMFVLSNNSSFKSFAYGVMPAWERSSVGPAGNMRQTYWWTEPRHP